MENTLRKQNKELVKKLKKNIEDFVTAQVAEFEKETGAVVEVIRIDAQKLLSQNGDEIPYRLNFAYKIEL